jgi:hypothetical protein
MGSRRKGQDIAVADGRIAEVAPRIEADALREIDARGRLVCPPFVDAHFHMDATLSLGLPRMNKSGTLLEGIQLWGELKPLLTAEAVIERALAYCDWAVARGLLAIRSHVDICDPRLLAVEALLLAAPPIWATLLPFGAAGLRAVVCGVALPFLLAAAGVPLTLDRDLRAAHLGNGSVGMIASGESDAFH